MILCDFHSIENIAPPQRATPWPFPLGAQIAVGEVVVREGERVSLVLSQQRVAKGVGLNQRVRPLTSGKIYCTMDRACYLARTIDEI